MGFWRKTIAIILCASMVSACATGPDYAAAPPAGQPPVYDQQQPYGYGEPQTPYDAWASSPAVIPTLVIGAVIAGALFIWGGTNWFSDL